jgi:hypothetical protein
MNRGQRQAVQKGQVGQDEVPAFDKTLALDAPGPHARSPGASRPSPPGASGSPRSRSGAWRRLCGSWVPQEEPIDRPTRCQDWTLSQKRPGSRPPCALPPALAVDKLPAWVMNHLPRSTEPSLRCRILRGVGSSSISTYTRLNGRRPRSPRPWACIEPSLMHISSGLWHSGTWCQVSDEARLANPPSCTGSPGGKSNSAIRFDVSHGSRRSWPKRFAECPRGPARLGKRDGCMVRRWSPSPRTRPNPRFSNSLRWLRNTCSLTVRSSHGTASSVRRVNRPRTSSASSTPASSRAPSRRQG